MAEEIKNEDLENKEQPKADPTPKKTEEDGKKDDIDIQAQLQALMIENAKLKKATDKATHEASDYKQKWKASLSEQEQASIEKAEREVEREEQFNKLLRENKINKVEKNYLAMQYTPEEASKMAIAEVDNDFEEKIKIMAQVDARKKTEYEAEFIKNRPSVNMGVGGEKTNITKAEFDKMGYKQRIEFFNKYPNTYAEFTNH